MASIDPTKERFAAFKDLPQDEPVHMLNLVRLRDKAAYPDGREATGREAYQAYGRESGPVFRRLGGRQVWIGRPDLTLIGPADERWDIAFIAEYPSGPLSSRCCAIPSTAKPSSIDRPPWPTPD
jgi:hypothetical protein